MKSSTSGLYLAVLVHVMVIDRPKLLTLILDIISNVQVPVGISLPTEAIQVCSAGLTAMQDTKAMQPGCIGRSNNKSGPITYSAGSNMFFSSRHCVAMGDLGPSTPCSCCKLGFCHCMEDAAEEAGGPGRPPACTNCSEPPTGTVLALLPPRAPAKQFITAARALAVRFSPPCSAPVTCSTIPSCT